MIYTDLHYESLNTILYQIQLTVSEDGIVTVVEPGSSKIVDKEELHEAIKIPENNITVQQLQQIVGQQVCCTMFIVYQASAKFRAVTTFVAYTNAYRLGTVGILARIEMFCRFSWTFVLVLQKRDKTNS